MSETLSPAQANLAHQVASPDLVEATFVMQAERYSEIAENYDEVQQVGQYLAETCNVSTETLEDPAKLLIFSAASMHVLQSGSAELAIETVNLLGPNPEKEKSDADSREFAILSEKYIDKQLTAELEQSIRDGLLDELKSELGVTEENEDPYEIRVLSIGADNILHGIGPETPEYDNNMSREESIQVGQEYETQRNLIQEYTHGLKSRKEELMKSAGREGEFMAWVEKVDGVTYLYLQAPTVEKILHPEVTEHTKYYDDNDYAHDLALLKHEYTHTQGGLNVDGDAKIGIGLEEVRAEHFSGNKLGYFDIKSFCLDVRVASGVDIVGIMEQNPKGSSTEQIMGSLAETVGLSKALEIMLSSPRTYQEEGPSAKIAELMGGYDGVIEGLLQDQVEKGESAEVEERIDKFCDQLIKNDDEGEFVLSYRKHQGANVISDLVRDRIRYRDSERAVA